MWVIKLTSAATAGAATDAQSGGSFPAFDPWHWPSQMFWLCISFAVLYLFLSRFILPSISDTLETRADRIQSDLDEAERLALKVAKLDEALEKTLAQARAKAKASEAEIKKELEAELAFATNQRGKIFDEKLEQSAEVVAEIKRNSNDNVADAAVDVSQAMLAAFSHRVGRVEAKNAVKAALSAEKQNNG